MAQSDKPAPTDVPGTSSVARQIGVGAIFSIFAIIFTLLLVEILFRVFSHFGPTQAAWNDRPRQYYFVKASGDVRDFAYHLQKQAGNFRIVVIGDSFTFGDYLQFDDTFPKRLERYLNLNSESPRVEVINYGVSSYSTRKESFLLRQALKLQPDLILLEITLNDPELVPFHPKHAFQDRFGKVQLPKIFNYWKSLKFFVERVLYAQLERQYRAYFHNLFSEQRSLSNFERGLNSFQHITTQHHVPLAAVLFPLFDSSFDSKYEFLPEHGKIDTLLTEREIPHLDLLSYYSGIPTERLQVLPHENAHPNEIAHRIAAEAIYEWMKEQNLAPQAAFASFHDKVRIGLKPPVLP